MFLILLHMFRNVYTSTAAAVGSAHFLVGYFIYLTLSLCCFTGYSLPRSNVAYHALVVLTSLVTLVPIYGDAILLALYGGTRPSCSSTCMVRVWLIHMLAPILLCSLVYEHIRLLHLDCSTQRMFEASDGSCKVYGYVILMDLWCVLLWSCVLAYCCHVVEDVTYDSAHSRPADPHATPVLKPEWYFLPAYGVLRSVPHRSCGLLCVLVLMAYPLLDAVSVSGDRTSISLALHLSVATQLHVDHYHIPPSPTLHYVDELHICHTYVYHYSYTYVIRHCSFLIPLLI